MIVLLLIQKIIKFQHTAARRRLRNQCGLDIIGMWVSTHSRPKAAAEKVFASNAKQGVSTHSRPKAAANIFKISFDSILFQHTAARRRLQMCKYAFTLGRGFQHTAARRRLLFWLFFVLYQWFVSTHSRPKAAASKLVTLCPINTGFNTQPPEGGCKGVSMNFCTPFGFNTQPPEGGCVLTYPQLSQVRCFNTQPPEGGCREFALGMINRI